jgi:hypothetical protein
MANTDNSNKFWWVVSAGIVVTVLGGLILAALMSDTFSHFVWNCANGTFVDVAWFFSIKSIVPLYLIFLLCIPALVAIGYLWRQAYEKSEEYKTSYEHYWQDTFDGAVWKWAYLRGRVTPPQPEW